MANKLWHGRFKKGTHPLLEKFSESLSYDRELARVDIRGSLAHAAMLARVKLIAASDLASIKRGLAQVEKEIAGGTFVYRAADEDIHMAIEARLTAIAGEPAKRLHTARSRNDQVATDLRLWLRDKIAGLQKLLRRTQAAAVAVADREKELVIPGYTHLQRAQPVLLAQHLLAYVEMWERDFDRLADANRRVNFLPLGACALAGTTLPIDREFVAQELGFAGLCANSMDAVSDRDFVIETLAALAILFVHLSRLSEDLILWASSEWRLIKLDDAWSTGSSIMPQKRNPDFLELTRGKTGAIFGALTTLLTIMKGLPLTYNRDLQEDKTPLFGAVATAELTLTCFAEFIPTLFFDKKRAAAMLADGFLEATALAEYLVEKKTPFRDAHRISGELVRIAEDTDRRLADLSLEEMQAVSPAIGPDLLPRLNPQTLPNAYRSAGSAGTVEVKKSLARWKKKLGR
ncbi:argininosuccinate lyase [Planctomycetales bacterium]|nr:argininosuccinate lyase [Planctomycetales bacterium]